MKEEKLEIVDQSEDPAAPQVEDLLSLLAVKLSAKSEDPAVPRARTRAKLCQSKGCDQPSVFYHKPSHKRYCRRHYIQIVNAKARG